MSKPTCAAITRQGERCKGPALPGKEWCFAHDPDLSDVRAKARIEGGYGKRSERRAFKRMPQGVKGALAVLERTLGALEANDMEPSRGQAIASVAKAVVVAYEAAAVSERLDALEAKVNDSAAGTAGQGRAA